MSSRLLTVRYPSRPSEFHLSDEAPVVGDVLTRNGDSWVVEEVTTAPDGATVVTLHPGVRSVAPKDG